MYVLKDEHGQIYVAFANPQGFPTEELDPADPELMAFLAARENHGPTA